MNKLKLIILLLCAISTGYGQEHHKYDTLKLTTDSIVLIKVEVEAEAEGGKKGWSDFLERNLNLDVPYFNSAPRGVYKVIVRFIVYKDGTIGDFKALTKHGYGMEKEVIRALKLSPKWKPALQNGTAVNAYRNQPVAFFVRED
ncbi:MAG TPA: energy transducer TonB [Ferruginibacter sp.]|nr:energy transducer TonB [Ferruginibacter sp.]